MEYIGITCSFPLQSTCRTISTAQKCCACRSCFCLSEVAASDISWTIHKGVFQSANNFLHICGVLCPNQQKLWKCILIFYRLRSSWDQGATMLSGNTMHTPRVSKRVMDSFVNGSWKTWHILVWFSDIQWNIFGEKILEWWDRRGSFSGWRSSLARQPCFGYWCCFLGRRPWRHQGQRC